MSTELLIDTSAGYSLTSSVHVHPLLLGVLLRLLQQSEGEMMEVGP